MIVDGVSLLLLTQIPPPRVITGPRWDVKTILDIVFECHRVGEGLTTEIRDDRRQIGDRLLTLVSNGAVSRIHTCDRSLNVIS